MFLIATVEQILLHDYITLVIHASKGTELSGNTVLQNLSVLFRATYKKCILE